MKTSKIRIQNLLMAAARTLPVAGMLLLAACHPDYMGGHYITDGRGEQAVVKAVLSSNLMPDAALQTGDQIALTTSYYDQYSLNRFYACGSDGATFDVVSGLPVFIKGKGYLTAYYPIVGEDGVEPAINLSTLDQDNLTSFFYACEPIALGDKDVMLNLCYVLGRMQVDITTAASEKIHRVVVSGFYHEATVDPYTWRISLGDAPSSYVLEQDGSINTFSLDLIPQTVDSAAVIPAQLTLIGEIRSYEVALGTVQIDSDQLLRVSVDVSGASPTVAFSTDGVSWTNYEDKLQNSTGFDMGTAPWTDSGKGGNVESN